MRRGTSVWFRPSAKRTEYGQRKRSMDRRLLAIVHVVGRYMYGVGGQSVRRCRRSIQCCCWLLPQAATALTRNRPSSFPPPALGQAFAGSATSVSSKQLGRPALFLCFCALLCDSSFSLLVLIPGAQRRRRRRYAAQPRTDSRWVSPPQFNQSLSKPQFKPASKTRQIQDGVHRRRQGPRP